MEDYRLKDKDLLVPAVPVQQISDLRFVLSENTYTRMLNAANLRCWRLEDGWLLWGYRGFVWCDPYTFQERFEKA